MISSWNCNKTVCLKTSPIEIEPEKNFSTNKSIKFLGSGVIARVGRVSGNNIFLGLGYSLMFAPWKTIKQRTLLEPSQLF